ncbi:MAG: hypothetical protein JSW39_06090, partial [Desulfobacterales bacterium]
TEIVLGCIGASLLLLDADILLVQHLPNLMFGQKGVNDSADDGAVGFFQCVNELHLFIPCLVTSSLPPEGPQPAHADAFAVW